MPWINTIKAIILSVLIITGSAISSKADGGGYFAITSVMSAVVSLIQETVMEMHSFVVDGHGIALFSIGG